MSIADVKEPSLHVHRKVDGVAHASFRRIHISAELRGHDRAARLAIRGSYADASKEGMNRYLDRKVRIERLVCRGIGRMINVIKPNALLQRLLEHRRVVRTAERTKPRRVRADPGISIYLEIENLYDQRIARFGPFNVKRPCDRIIAFGHAQRVA